MNSHLESCFSFTSQPILFADESNEEGEVEVETKEEWELGVVQSWKEVEGFPALPEEEAWGLFCEVSTFLSFSLVLACISHSPCVLSLIPMLTLYFLFSGSELAKEGQHSKKGGPAAGVGRAAENQVSSGRIRGRGFLWAPEGSCISHSHFLCPTPT